MFNIQLCTVIMYCSVGCETCCWDYVECSDSCGSFSVPPRLKNEAGRVLRINGEGEKIMRETVLTFFPIDVAARPCVFVMMSVK